MLIDVPEPFEDLWVPSRYKAFHGGRGSGKSHSAATALLAQGYERELRIGCFREVQRSINASVKQLLDDKIKSMGLKGFYRSTETSITAKNGTEFLFAGLRTNPDSVKSMEGLDRAWVEEANTVSRRSLQLLTPTVRNPDSELWFTWNRRYTSDPVDEMFLGGKPPPRSIVKQVNWRENPWFPDVLMEEMLWDKSRDHDKYRHVWEGEPVMHSEAKVFRNWSVGDLDDVIPKGCVPRFGADWGFANDPTVLIRAYIWENTLYINAEAWRIGCPIIKTPQLFDTVGDSRRYPVIADGSRPETIDHMKNHGFPKMRKAVKGAGSIEDGIEFMKNYDIVVHPDCVHVIEELETYSYKVDELTDEVLPVLEDKKNHTMDACRYAVEAIRRMGRGRIAAVGATELIEGNE